MSIYGGAPQVFPILKHLLGPHKLSLGDSDRDRDRMDRWRASKALVAEGDQSAPKFLLAGDFSDGKRGTTVVPLRPRRWLSASVVDSDSDSLIRPPAILRLASALHDLLRKPRAGWPSRRPIEGLEPAPPSAEVEAPGDLPPAGSADQDRGLRPA